MSIEYRIRSLKILLTCCCTYRDAHVFGADEIAASALENAQRMLWGSPVNQSSSIITNVNTIIKVH